MTGLVLAASEIDVPIVLFGVGGLVAVVAIVSGNLRRVLTTREREMSRRELAAYVAEGTMTPQDAERILKAGKPTRTRDD
jgi:hypothetical protein